MQADCLFVLNVQDISSSYTSLHALKACSAHFCSARDLECKDHVCVGLAWGQHRSFGVFHTGPSWPSLQSAKICRPVFSPVAVVGLCQCLKKRSGTCFLKYPQGNLMTFQGIENVYEWRPGQDMSGSSNIFQLSTNCLLEDDPNDILQLLRFHQLDAGQVIHDCREIVWANLVQQACSLSTAIIRRSKKMKDMLKILEEFCPWINYI